MFFCYFDLKNIQFFRNTGLGEAAPPSPPGTAPVHGVKMCTNTIICKNVQIVCY